MTSWSDFTAEAPGLAGEVHALLTARKHHVMATLRADGSPRLNGTEVVLTGGELWLAGMVGARRFADLRRDPRVALHSGSEDPPQWSGDARVAGRAVEVTSEAVRASVVASLPEGDPGPFELFRVDLTEVVGVRLSDDRETLVVETWRPGAEVARWQRH